MSPCKLLEQNFANFTIRGRFCKKNAKIATNFQVLRIQVAITTQRLQIAGTSLQNNPLTECLVSILLLESIQSLSSGLYTPNK